MNVWIHTLSFVHCSKLIFSKFWQLMAPETLQRPFGAQVDLGTVRAVGITLPPGRFLVSWKRPYHLARMIVCNWGSGGDRAGSCRGVASVTRLTGGCGHNGEGRGVKERRYIVLRALYILTTYWLGSLELLLFSYLKSLGWVLSFRWTCGCTFNCRSESGDLGWSKPNINKWSVVFLMIECPSTTTSWWDIRKMTFGPKAT